MPDAATQAPATTAGTKDYLAPVFAQYPVDVARAEGVWLYTPAGRRVLDLYGGHAVAALGYGHPGWTTAVTRQAQQVNFQSNAVPMDVRRRAAERLIAFSQLPFASVFFVNSGAEANENALKMAFTMTGRSEVVSLVHGWHGRTAAAAAITWGAEKWYGFPRKPFDTAVIPRDDVAGVAGITTRTAAVFVEPVQGVGGAYDIGREMLQALRARCDETGALLVFDEVQCGMGRTGQPFGANYYGVMPDMITTAKALGNGFPCSALLMNERVAAAVKLDALGTTFGGGPMACAAIEAVVDALEGEQLLANVRRVSDYIRRTCVTGPVTATRGAGFLLGLKTRIPAKQVQKALLDQHDILTGTSAEPDYLRLLPPYILKEQDVDLLAQALARIPG